MRFLALVAVLVCVGRSALAGDDHRRPGVGADVDVFVPVDPYEHERMYWKRRSDRHLVPGTVSIDGESPYVCDLDDATFDDREKFVAHIRLRHQVPPERIPELLVPVDGVIHFAGE